MKHPNLSDETKGRAPFKIPENYFSDFETRIMTHIETIEDKPSQAIPKVTLFQRVKPYIYLAAMISGLAFGVHVYNTHIQSQEINVQALSNPSDEEMEDYLEHMCNYALINSSDIYHYIANLDDED